MNEKLSSSLENLTTLQSFLEASDVATPAVSPARVPDARAQPRGLLLRVAPGRARERAHAVRGGGARRAPDRLRLLGEERGGQARTGRPPRLVRPDPLHGAAERVRPRLRHRVRRDPLGDGGHRARLADRSSRRRPSAWSRTRSATRRRRRSSPRTLRSTSRAIRAPRRCASRSSRASRSRSSASRRWWTRPPPRWTPRASACSLRDTESPKAPPLAERPQNVAALPRRAGFELRFPILFADRQWTPRRLRAAGRVPDAPARRHRGGAARHPRLARRPRHADVAAHDRAPAPPGREGRSVPPDRAPRPRRDGRRVGGAPRAAAPADGGQAARARDRGRARARALRARGAADRGPDAPEHDRDLRLRPHGRRRLLLRDGAPARHQPRPARRARRPARARPRRAPAAPGVRRAHRGARRRPHPSRHQAGQHHALRLRRHPRLREGPRLRPRQGDRRRRAARRTGTPGVERRRAVAGRLAARHAALHGARGNDRPRRASTRARTSSRSARSATSC